MEKRERERKVVFDYYGRQDIFKKEKKNMNEKKKIHEIKNKICIYTY